MHKKATLERIANLNARLSNLIKHASSVSQTSYRVMWGTPPKPNVWSCVYEGREDGGHIWKIQSPLIIGYFIIAYHPSWGAEGQIVYVKYHYSGKARSTVFDVTDGRVKVNSSEEIFSNRFYKQYVEPKIKEGLVELKVSNLG